MRQLERSVENRFVELCNGASLTHVKCTPEGTVAWPDRLILAPGGRAIFVELKRPGEEPRPAQAHIHRRLKSLGYTVIVADDADEAFQKVCITLGVI
jgi:hypothetical protein